MALVIVGAAAVIGSLILTPAVIWFGHRRGLVCEPDGVRRIHHGMVPRIGGIAVFAGTCAGLLASAFLAPLGGDFVALAAAHMPFFGALLIGGLIMFVTGMLDDAYHLRARDKLIAQVVGALLVWAVGFRIDALSIGFGTDIALGWLGLPVTVLWIIGVTNAYNLIDGLDGLASGIALIALVAIGVAAAMLGNFAVLLVAVALSGSLAGFLVYNFNPARVFLGDSGSLFIGFMLAVLSAHGALKSTAAALTIVPLLALGVPLIDMGLSILRRWLRGSPVFGADARHIHHRMLALGLTHRRVVVVLYAVTTGLALLGLLLAFSPPRQLMMVALLGGLASAGLVIVGLKGLDYDELFVASAVLASGPRRVKRVIRDRLHARDIALVLSASSTQAEIGAILADEAAEFGFLHMECVPEHLSSRRALEERSSGKRLWKLDFPLESTDAAHNDLVLRIWCAVGESHRPHGAERVAHILAPALDEAIARVHQDAPEIDWSTHISTHRSVRRNDLVRVLATG